jgi:hypothetical protein
VLAILAALVLALMWWVVQFMQQHSLKEGVEL